MNIRKIQNIEDSIFDTINTVLLLLILIVVVYPLVIIVSCSFSDPTAIAQGKVVFFPIGFNIDSYKRVFQDARVLNGFKNTILYTVVGTAINLALTIAGAYPLSRKDFLGKNVITAIFVFTMFFNGGIIPTYLVVKQLRLINNFWVMILPTAVSVWNLIIMRTFFKNSIPEELYEAAGIDGCSHFKMLFRIVLPLSAPIIAVMVLFYGVAHWNAFFNALMYITDRQKYPLQMILRAILLESFQTESMINTTQIDQSQHLLIAEALKYALIIVASVPVLILYPFLQKYFVKGVMIGAIKG